MTDAEARILLKKHAATYGDSKYEPAYWVIEAIKEAAYTPTEALRKACGDDEELVNSYLASVSN